MIYQNKFKRNKLALAVVFTLSLSNSALYAACYDNGRINGVVIANGGQQCDITGSYYSGNNVVAAYDTDSKLNFTADTATIRSNYASTHALSVGGINSGGGSISPGATIEANHLIVQASPGINSRAIYIHSGTTDKQNLLYVKKNLTATSTASGGSAVQLAGANAVLKVDGNTNLSTTNADGLRNAGKVHMGGNLTISSARNSIQNSGQMNVQGITELKAPSNSTTSTAISNSGIGAVITFNDNVTSTHDTTAINNQSSAIVNFMGLSNTFNGNIINASGALINLSNGVAGGKLEIAGNYSGTGGILQIDTQLNDDSSATDFIKIGGTATGSTELRVNNVGGNGAQTNKGIKVIETKTSTSDAFFIANGGYVTAGAYDYGLFHQTEDGLDNWYLKSKTKDTRTLPPTDPVYTPDVGEYLAAETMGNTLFTSRLEDREGASQYQNLWKNNDVGNVWVHVYGSRNQFNSMQGQLKTIGNSYVTQIGTSLATLGEKDQYNLGVLGGFAYYDGKTRSKITDRESKTKINGYSLGLYGTWYAHPVEKHGAYIDSWVLWNKFNNKVDTADQNQYKYDSSGITASIEAGGDYLLNKSGKKDWWIQPQAQIIYQGVHADEFKDAQGSNIDHGRDNLQARLGIKTYLNVPTNGNNLISYRPYVALNFIHNTNPYSVAINNERFENQGSANLGELKVGVEGNITQNSQVWLNASYVAGSQDNQTYQGNIGWKYNF